MMLHLLMIHQAVVLCFTMVVDFWKVDRVGPAELVGTATFRDHGVQVVLAVGCYRGAAVHQCEELINIE